MALLSEEVGFRVCSDFFQISLFVPASGRGTGAGKVSVAQSMFPSSLVIYVMVWPLAAFARRWVETPPLGSHLCTLTLGLGLVFRVLSSRIRTNNPACECCPFIESLVKR